MADNFNEIKAIAGRFLGKTMSGESMTPYEAPDKHDASLLVPIPRSIGRTNSYISAPFVGYDVWHAYEFSFLLHHQPVTGVLKFVFPYNSTNMIESKSFKLYLNSFDFENFESVGRVIKIIEEDVSKVTGGWVHVNFHPSGLIKKHTNKSLYQFIDNASNGSIDRVFISDIVFDENIESLKTKGADMWFNKDHVQYFHTANLRSACEITNQKDTGHCIIAMISDYEVNRAELARFIFSLRDSQHFHENVTEIVYNKLYNFFEPSELLVFNIYNRRGGLDIHPIRSSSELFLRYTGISDYFTSNTYSILTNQV